MLYIVVLKMIPRNNKTASPFLKSEFSKTNTSGIKPSSGKSKLTILCTNNSCTKFDENGKALIKVLMNHEPRHALYRCPKCDKTVSERQLNYVIHAQLTEFLYHDENTNKDIKEIEEERERTEKLMVRPINAESPQSKSKRNIVRIVK
jgi:Leucine-rich repeat (LRR) protein